MAFSTMTRAYLTQMRGLSDSAVATLRSNGGKWDVDRCRWFVSDPISWEACSSLAVDAVSPWPDRDWRQYAFEQRDQARADGMWFDPTWKCYYKPTKDDRAEFKRNKKC